MADLANESYIDAKGRHRWRCNDQIAEKLNQLHDLLVIGGYEESHARRYPQLAYAISRHPESILMLHEEDRLSLYITMATTCRNPDWWASDLTAEICAAIFFVRAHRAPPIRGKYQVHLFT